jgi:hypothetical protein
LLKRVLRLFSPASDPQSLATSCRELYDSEATSFSKNRASAALAEFFGDIALCPLEATCIRLVSQPTFASGLASALTKIAKQEGIGALYSGFGPILLKQ